MAVLNESTVCRLTLWTVMALDAHCLKREPLPDEFMKIQLRAPPVGE